MGGEMSANAEAVTVLITCPIRAGREEQARREFSEIIRVVVRDEDACHGIWLHEDPENLQQLMLIEHWDSKEIFTGAHMQTPHMQAFLERAAEFLAGAPDFRFWHEIARAT
jgi:quinol monooxygenase YgiN